MIPRFLEGDEAVEYCQGNIQSLVEMIGCNTDIILWKGKYPPDDKIKALNFVVDCYKLLYNDGNCGFYHVRLSELYQRMANCYLALKDETNMFACLEKSVQHAINFDALKDGKYTAFMVNKVECSSQDAVKTHTENQTGLLLKFLRKDKFLHLQDDPRMIKIIEKLVPVAII